MSLSKREASKNIELTNFNPCILAAALRDGCPEISFALLLGSARDGYIPAGGDLDLSVSLDSRLNLALLGRIAAIAKSVLPGNCIDIDIGCFDRAEPVYRFEALKGRLLFARDNDRFLDAYSLACREYESQMYDYARQARYRLQRKEVAA